ncbi:MAG TPA: hypothetical protein VH393_11420 [Ktedonobacterales bacterium]
MSHADPRDEALRQRYADILLEEPGDPALTGLVRDLDRAANRPAPDQLQARIGEEVLAAIERRKTEESVQRAMSPVTSRIPARRLIALPSRPSSAPNRNKPRRALRALSAAAIVFAALLLVAGGGAYAISRIDPGLAFQLGIPVATGPEYTKLEVTHTVADRTITLSRAAFTREKVIIGYTYDYPADSRFSGGICALSLTSDKADSFREFAEDDLGQGANNGVAHGSRVMYFAVERLDSSHQNRHLRLTLHPCEGPGASELVAFDFTLPVQR